MPALDGVRGVAILLVLAFHANLLPGGWLGVDLFFALSGFLITGLLLAEHERRGISLRWFYRRRALRLLPALTFILVAFLLLGLVGGAPRLVITNLVVGLGYCMNVAAAFGYDPGAFIHLWTLAQEEQFYLLWPPILLLLLHRRVRPVAIGCGLVAAAVAFTAWRVVLEAHGATGPRVWWGPDTNAVPIILGCAAAVAFTYLPRLKAGPAAVLLLPVSVMVIGSWWQPRYGLSTNLPGAAFAVLVLGVATSPWLARPFELRPLRAVGKVSYGLYLWHLPVFVAFGWKAGLPVAIVITLISWRYVERPFLRRQRPSRDLTYSAPAMLKSAAAA